MASTTTEQVDNCAICLDSLATAGRGKKLLKTPCNHVFHRPCLLQWFNSGNPGDYCPLCKVKTSEADAIRVSFGVHKIPLRRSDRIQAQREAASTSGPPDPSAAIVEVRGSLFTLEALDELVQRMREYSGNAVLEMQNDINEMASNRLLTDAELQEFREEVQQWRFNTEQEINSFAEFIEERRAQMRN